MRRRGGGDDQEVMTRTETGGEGSLMEGCKQYAEKRLSTMVVESVGFVYANDFGMGHPVFELRSRNSSSVTGGKPGGKEARRQGRRVQGQRRGWMMAEKPRGAAGRNGHGHRGVEGWA